ncbi:hypothetical protein HN709_01360 [Candidatus Peregrinibacteria bacterium]|jgi:hypothetical protein|nr:hypothetical protein [Candidatus Peregrinibacteria bacterium]MBT7736311.1 hypothetical protein [Candidatus Peregrinibacteria bacterium]
MAGPEKPDFSKHEGIKDMKPSEILKYIYEAGKEKLEETGLQLKGIGEIIADQLRTFTYPKRLLERGMKTYKSIDDALKELHLVTPQMDEKGIVLRLPEYYFAIALKESHYNPFAVSNLKRGKDGEKLETEKDFQLKKEGETAAKYKQRLERYAMGAFQVKLDALKSVNRHFGLNFKKDDIIYIPEGLTLEELKSADFSKLSPKERQKLRITMMNNAKVAILYWHICRDIAPAEGMGKYDTKIEFTSPADQDKLAAFLYNYGTSRGGTLIAAIKPAPKTYAEFEEGVAKIMAKQSKIKLPEEQYTKGKSSSNQVYFSTWFSRKERGQLKSKSYLKIDRSHVKNVKPLQSAEYSPSVVLAGLDYSAIIDSIRKGRYFSTVKLTSVPK